MKIGDDVKVEDADAIPSEPPSHLRPYLCKKDCTRLRWCRCGRDWWCRTCSAHADPIVHHRNDKDTSETT